MNKFSVVLPMPPTTNNMFVNNPRGGRFPSKEYKDWQRSAGTPLDGPWPERFEDADDLWWKWRFTVYGLTKVSDLSNRIKAPEDMIVTMTGLKDHKVIGLHAYREDEHAEWGRCVMIEVEIVE